MRLLGPYFPVEPLASGSAFERLVVSEKMAAVRFFLSRVDAQRRVGRRSAARAETLSSTEREESGEEKKADEMEDFPG